jgi:glycosyltransferase involved in cell wall biosynthesis
VESVLGQSYERFELLIIDDGSNDHTAAALNPYRHYIRYFKQENRGVSATRNRGIRESRGDLIAFLDSDDSWRSDKLERQVSFFLSDPDAAVCYTDEIWIRRGRLVNSKKKHGKYSGSIFEKVLPLCIISPSSIMLRRSVFDKVGLFDENLPVCEDYDMWIRIAKHYPIHFIPHPLIIKRGGHCDQLSGRYWGMDRFRVKALSKALDSGCLTDEQRSLVLKQLIRRCDILSEGCLKRGKVDESSHYRSISLKYRTDLHSIPAVS